MPDDKDKQEGQGITVPGQQAAGPSDSQLLMAGAAGIKNFASGAYDATMEFFKSGVEKTGRFFRSVGESFSGMFQSSPPPEKKEKSLDVKPATMKAGPSDQQLLSAGMAGVSALATGAYNAVKGVVAPDKPQEMEETWLNPRIKSVAVTNLHLEMEVDGKVRRFEISPKTESRLRSGEVTPNELANLALAKLDEAQRRVSMNYEMGQMRQGENIGQSMKR